VNLNLELTDHCNLRCRMCSQSLRDEAHGEAHRFMAFDTWSRALDGLAGAPDVTLCPHWLGEPTLHPDFDRFVEHAFTINAGNRLFRHFKVHTNAVILGEARARLLIDLAQRPGLAADTFLAVHFSIDAWARDTYTRVKGADRREQVFANVARFLALRGGARRPAVHLAFVVQDGNTDDVVPFVQHWRAVMAGLGRDLLLTGEWPPMDRDALYLRRWNTADQAHADGLHAVACRAVGIEACARAEGSF
jgi:molybdenum cofactor biosynthesis enzyme MoaA